MATVSPPEEAEDILVLFLPAGTVTIDLLPDVAPETVTRIKTLTRAGEYDDVAFHRVFPGFVAQTGDVEFGNLAENYDPARVGTGGSDLPDLPLEPTDEFSFVRGAVGMARAAAPDSGNSQFFITYDDATFLDGDYTLFGEVSYGMPFVDRLKAGDPALNGRVEGVPDRILQAVIADDLAPGATAVGTGRADRIQGTAADEAALGLGGRDVIKARGGDDTVLGGEGNDVLRLGGGSDAAAGEGGRDRLFGGGGDDFLRGDGGRDRLVGKGGADILDGGNGDDDLRGGRGRDTLVGGAGDDVLRGGQGADTFAFLGTETGDDRILGGFVLGEDTIDLSGTDLSLADLSISRSGRSAVVEFGDLGTLTVEDLSGSASGAGDVFIFA